jgi:hypothetical protein
LAPEFDEVTNWFEWKLSKRVSELISKNPSRSRDEIAVEARMCIEGMTHFAPVKQKGNEDE